MFASIGSFSGALSAAHQEPPPLAANATEAERKDRQQYEDLVGKFGSKEQKDRDPFELAAKIPGEEVPMLFVVCGGEDGNAGDTHAFLALLAKRRIPYEYREISPREHDWRIWNEEIPVFLDKLDHLDGFGSALPQDGRQDSCAWRIVISPIIPWDSLPCYHSSMRHLVDKERRLVMSTFSGAFMLADGLSHQEKLVKDPDFAPSFS